MSRPEPGSSRPDDTRGNGGRCFHPIDDVARGPGTGTGCLHPADDLATDLHLRLTSADDHQLALLAGR
jgi:hypothetical protein